jgi:DNA-binding cell septation regulator SpoVG
MKISDIKLRKIGKGKLLASGSFRHGDVKVNFTVIEGAKGAFVALPSREYTDKEGNKQRTSEVFIEGEENYKSLQSQVMEAYRNLSANNPTSTQQKLPESYTCPF